VTETTEKVSGTGRNSVIDTEDIYVALMTFLKANRKQVELADEADVIIFVVDVEEGITPMDDAVASYCVKSLNQFYLQ
jgi:predicted GTPase